MTASANRLVVQTRQQELVQEARDMVNGKTRVIPTLLHLTALLMELEGAQCDTEAALTLAKAREDERLSLVNDLRDARELLAGFIEGEAHVFVDFCKKTYTVERRYRREYGVFSDWKEAMALLKRLRAGESPFASTNDSQRTA